MFTAAALALLVTVVLALVRALAGPTVFDRAQAANTIGTVAMLLLAVIGLRGLCLGIAQPIEIAITSRALGADMQGTGVGLRTTANRLASAVVPMIMGGVAGVVGVEDSFLVMGAILLVVMAAAAVYVRRNPALGRHEPEDHA